MALQFQIDDQEEDRLHKWTEEHDKTCKFSDPMKQGAIGGRLTFQFTNTGLGQLASVKCACGEEKLLTDAGML